MDTKIKVETRVVTPEMANKWLEANQYEYQRPIMQGYAKFLAEEMKAGTFKEYTTIEFSRVNGDWLLTDGRHRLSAVAWSGVAQPFVISWREISSEDQLALDYGRTDRGKRRSVGDIYRPLGIADELGLTNTQVLSLGSAAVLILNEFGSTSQTKVHSDVRLRVMREYGDAMGEYLESIAGCRSELMKKLLRSATLGVALVTFRYSTSVYGAEKVDKFWHGTAMDDGLSADDARKVANRHLVEVGMAGGLSKSPKQAQVSYSSRWLANCFNAYVDGKTRQFTRVTDPNKPILIKGSPFTGK